MTHPLIRKLEHRTLLSDEEKEALAKASTRSRDLRPDEDLVREGDGPEECHVILDGVLCRYKLLPEGKRQIIGFQIAGDLCDLCGLVMGRMDHSVGALTRAKLAVIPNRTLHEITQRFPRLAAALWQETMVDASISREWLANIGRRSAYQRLAHLICEMGLRLQAAGRASEDGGFSWPVTQAEVADAMGLSTVHVNRMLQQLRGEGLILSRGDTVTVLDWSRLRRAGEFTPDYLFLGPIGGNGAAPPPVRSGPANGEPSPAPKRSGVPHGHDPSAHPG